MPRSTPASNATATNWTAQGSRHTMLAGLSFQIKPRCKMPSNQCCSCRLPEIPEQRPPSGTARYVLFRRFEFVGKEIFEVSATWRSFTAFKRATLRPRAARLRQARWAASLHKMRRCGSGAFDVRYTLNSGAKSNVAGCPSWV